MLRPMTIVGNHDAQTIEQLKQCVQAGAVAGVLCADGHYGYSQPVGGVIAYKEAVSISGVGFDIACGNLAYKTDIKLQDIIHKLPNLADAIHKNISFGVGRKNSKPVDHPILTDDPAWDIPFVKGIQTLAHQQLGTVGSGNHYVDIFQDSQTYIWVGVHFGSRGLGYKIADHYLKLAGGKDCKNAPPTVVSTLSTLGQEYLHCLELAGKYAYVGREYVAKYVVEHILGANIIDTVHNHHNYAWEEIHKGESYWVVRKGATPAFPGQRGFVGGSMGDCSVILEGVSHPFTEDLLYSTVHGAGRVMSRTQAAGKFKWVRGHRQCISPGAINEANMIATIAAKGIHLRGGGADEAPEAYRSLRSVLDAHAPSIRILEVLQPLIVVMAGNEEIDPYKD